MYKYFFCETKKKTNFIQQKKNYLQNLFFITK